MYLQLTLLESVPVEAVTVSVQSHVLHNCETFLVGILTIYDFLLTSQILNLFRSRGQGEGTWTVVP